MDFKKSVKLMLLQKDKEIKDLANMLGIESTNASRLLRKPDFKLKKDIIRIADLLGYDAKLTFIDRKTGKEIDCE